MKWRPKGEALVRTNARLRYRDVVRTLSAAILEHGSITVEAIQPDAKV